MVAKAFEILAWSAGITLLAIYGATRITISSDSETALDSFEQAQLLYTATKHSQASKPALELGEIDTSLWSDTRIAAYRKANAPRQGEPLAVLRIPQLNLRVPVFPGTSAQALNRGAGHIAGTDLPGNTGNVGLAAHRDGFFRVLKDARVGQTVFLDLLDRTLEYRIAALDIVEPTNVTVLADTGTPRLTLVTCYPFYFVGPAPKRFIVRAEGDTPQYDELESALVQAPQHPEASHVESARAAHRGGP